MGVRGRGKSHIAGFGSRKAKDCEIVAIVDVDEAVGNRTVDAVKERFGKAPAYYRDIRKMLEDKSIDIVSIATPNHWHSLAAIWAMQAGKDVYVEKPVSHNVSEGRRLVQTARKHEPHLPGGHAVPHQSRHAGAIEFVRSARSARSSWPAACATSTAARSVPRATTRFPSRSITTCGPVPPRSSRSPARASITTGTGCGTTATATWAIRASTRWTSPAGVWASTTSEPVCVSYGGRLGYEDAGETANTQVSIHDYPNGKRLVFEVRGLPTPKLRGTGVGVIFYGTTATWSCPATAAERCLTRKVR